MSADRNDRSNEEWLQALKGEGESSALATRDLQAFLERIARRYSSRGFDAADLDDLVQESLTRIVTALDSFRGDSRFTTWAAGVLTRVAFTELRRRRVQADRGLSFEAVEQEAKAEELASSEPEPGAGSDQQGLMAELRRAIAEELTERQRVAILAELRGLPTVEIADRMNTTTGALYKLVHDARKRLRDSFLRAGFTADSLAEYLEADQ